jgi:hypothetical protein
MVVTTYERVIATTVIQKGDTVYADVKPMAADMMLDPEEQLTDLAAKYGAVTGTTKVYPPSYPMTSTFWPSTGTGQWHVYFIAGQEIGGSDLASIVDAADVWVVRSGAQAPGVQPPNVQPPNVTPPKQGGGGGISPMLLLLVVIARAMSGKDS